MTRAAAIGNRDAVQTLIAAGCPMDNDATMAACINGHEDVLRCLLDEGCPIVSRCLVLATQKYHVGVVKMLLESSALTLTEGDLSDALYELAVTECDIGRLLQAALEAKQIE